MVFFPECFDYVGENRDENETLALTEDGDYIGRYRNCAREYGLWLSLGGFHEKVLKVVLVLNLDSVRIYQF